MNQVHDVIVPFESDYSRQFLEMLDTLQHCGIDMKDLIREAIKISVSVIDRQDINDIVSHIDYCDVERAIDAMALDSNAYSKFSTMAWDAFTDSVYVVYEKVYPIMFQYIQYMGYRINIDAAGYRCDDVEILSVDHGHDHFRVRFRMVINMPYGDVMRAITSV